MRAALVTAAVLAACGVAQAQRPLHNPGVISNQPLPQHVMPRQGVTIIHSNPQAQSAATAPAHTGGRVFGPYSGPGGRGNPYGFGYTPLPVPYGYAGGFGYGIGLGGLNYYNGPAYLGPAINPPVYAFPPYGYGGAFGYGSAYYPLGPDPLNNSLLQYQYNNDWNVLSAKAAQLALQNESDPTAGAGAIPVPSTPEAKLKSLRAQAQGDEAFRNQDYTRAADRYRQALSVAKDNGAAAFRLGYTLVAMGRYAAALDYFKRGLALDPALALTGPTPDDLYGPDQQLAWTNQLGRATLWVKEDVRDPQRVLLLGLLLYYDGDPRSKEFLLRAWQLSGGTESIALKLLNPPKVNGAKDKGPVVLPADTTAPDGTPIGPLGTGREAAPVAPKADEGGEPTPEIPASGAEGNGVAPPASRRPVGQGPLFPLPSAQGQPADAANPPLPAPAEGAGAGESR
jgi:hypothetical protein